jgi:hypothetical protein
VDGGFALAHAHVAFEVVENHALVSPFMGGFNQPAGGIQIPIS